MKKQLQVPDKRFSHDHFSIETTVADVLQDFYRASRRNKSSKHHSLRSLIEHRALQVANDAHKNWHGEYGFPYEDASDEGFLNKIKLAIADYQNTDNNNAAIDHVDVLRYHFTPHSLAFTVDTLYALGLTDLRVHRLYETLADSAEFGMVLKRCTPV